MASLTGGHLFLFPLVAAKRVDLFRKGVKNAKYLIIMRLK